MRNRLILITLIQVLISSYALAQTNVFKPALVDFNAYEKLVEEVKVHRQSRLVDLNTFLQYSKEEKVVILNTRSDSMYNKAHIKGAIHLNFSDFTQQRLKELIPDPYTKILIYCNNNFESASTNGATQQEDLSQYFVTKSAMPKLMRTVNFPITLALNIPTYINLYGYGYRNVYELSELVGFADSRITFEGTAVVKK